MKYEIQNLKKKKKKNRIKLEIKNLKKEENRNKLEIQNLKRKWQIYSFFGKNLTWDILL